MILFDTVHKFKTNTIKKSRKFYYKGLLGRLKVKCTYHVFDDLKLPKEVER